MKPEMQREMSWCEHIRSKKVESRMVLFDTSCEIQLLKIVS